MKKTVSKRRHILLATDRNFDTICRDSVLPLLVVFSARWSVPSTALMPEFERLAASTPLLRFVSVDADASALLVRRFGVTEIPHFLYGAGKSWRRVSASTSSELRQRVLNLVVGVATSRPQKRLGTR